MRFISLSSTALGQIAATYVWFIIIMIFLLLYKLISIKYNRNH